MNLPAEFLDYVGVQYPAQNQLAVPDVPGEELSYNEITATVNVTGTTSGSPTTIISGTPVTLSNNRVMVEFFSPQVSTPSAAAGNTTNIGLYENGSLVSILAQVNTAAAATQVCPVFARWRFVPTAGSHTYSIAAWATNTTGTPRVFAGNGSGVVVPAYIRILKV